MSLAVNIKAMVKQCCTAGGWYVPSERPSDKNVLEA